MSETNPKVTVVVPLFNTERYIGLTLQCIARQTYTDYEVIIVNDASTDGGPQIVQNFIQDHPRFRMVTQENRGLAGARNSGIRAATGEYIALLDADDLWHPDKLARHVAHLDTNSAVGVSFCPSRFIDDEGNDMGFGQSPQLKDIDAEHVFCRNPVGNGSAAVIRRRALDAVEFIAKSPEGDRLCWFDESFRQSEDIEMWSRMAALTRWRFEGIPQELTFYRVSAGGLSANVEKQFESWCRMRDKIGTLNPSLVSAAGKRSEAYQLRYLGRRLAVGGQGRKALSLVWRAITLYPRILIEEPTRTIVTFGMASALALLPQRLGHAALQSYVQHGKSNHPPRVLGAGAR